MTARFGRRRPRWSSRRRWPFPSSASGAALPSSSATWRRRCFTPAARRKQAVGKAAPWFVLGVMLFSFAVRSVYMESCSMFVRGGVYVVVHDSMGPVAAKFSVSALVFDYILTGPISVVSAGQYIGALLERNRRTAAPELSTSMRTRSRRDSRCWSPFISGGRTSRACMNRAARRCASCRSPP